MARTAKKSLVLAKRRAQYDSMKEDDKKGRKRPGSTNAHKG